MARAPRQRSGCWSRSSGSAGRPGWRPGAEASAGTLLEDFGFTGDKLTTRLDDLSGGERRRLQFLRLLLAEPNVLLLDEPTNDLDIDTLTVIEDYLDSWPGTLIVVTHDRYFLERVCDVTYALMGDGSCVLLPGGVEQYLGSAAGPAGAERRHRAGSTPVRSPSAAEHPAGQQGPGPDRAADRQAGQAGSPPCTPRWPVRPPTTAGWPSCRPSWTLRPRSSPSSRTAGSPPRKGSDDYRHLTARRVDGPGLAG